MNNLFRKIFLWIFGLFLIILSANSHAQTWVQTNQGNTTTLINQKGGMGADLFARIPHRYPFIPNLDSCGRIWIDSLTNEFYINNCSGKQLIFTLADTDLLRSILGIASDTGTLTYADTLTILLTRYYGLTHFVSTETDPTVASYIKTIQQTDINKWDSAYTALGLKVNYIDTASMLFPYLRKSDTISLNSKNTLWSVTEAYPYSPGFIVTDTSGIAHGTNSSDAVIIQPNYEFVQNVSGSLQTGVVAVNDTPSIYLASALNGATELIRPILNDSAITTTLYLPEIDDTIASQTYVINHSGSVTYDFKFLITNTPDTTQKDTLWNGVLINAQYATSSAVTIPSFFGKNVHKPIVLNNEINDNVNYTKSSGVFTYPFQSGDVIEGQFEYSVGGGTGTSGGNIMMSIAEYHQWQVRAALLDPKAYRLYSQTGNSGVTVSVPVGETWYSLSQYQTHGSAYHQRPADVNQYIAFNGGTVIAPTGTYYMYVCEPKRVIDSDSRYTSDPEALYYNRLAILDTCTVNYINCIVSAGLSLSGGGTAAQVRNYFPVPNGTQLMIVGGSEYQIAWSGFTYRETEAGGVVDTLGNINAFFEINNTQSVRFATGLKYPINTAVMPGEEVQGGNDSGIISHVSVSGQGNFDYKILPAGWYKQEPLYYNEVGEPIYFDDRKSYYNKQ